jgi:hypothetical protein
LLLFVVLLVLVLLPVVVLLRPERQRVLRQRLLLVPRVRVLLR